MLLDYVTQLHNAAKAGPHTDLRFGNKGLGLYSWAVPKGMPEAGDRPRLGIAQSQHSHKYKDFQGTIPAGEYGAGTVETSEKGQALITRVEPNRIEFTLAHKKYPERYTMIRTGGRSWLVVNTTPVESEALEGFKKEHYKVLEPEEAEEVLRGSHAVSAKIDGAALVADIMKDRVEFLSYRRQKASGRPIVHTERVGGLTGLDIPEELVGTTLRGELYGERGGRAIPPQELSGLLNSSLARALKDKTDRRIKLKAAMFGILRSGKAIPGDPVKRLEAIRGIIAGLPVKGVFSTPPTETDPAKAGKLYKDIIEGRNPLTSEGIVAEPLAGGVPIKIKPREEADVYVRDVFPADTVRTGDVRAGGFSYSLEPEGPIVGNVGTGFEHSTLKDMLANPEQYRGRIARIRSQGQFEGGAHRAPSFVSMHEG